MALPISMLGTPHVLYPPIVGLIEQASLRSHDPTPFRMVVGEFNPIASGYLLFPTDVMHHDDVHGR
jgi:hypothetical protein